MYKAYVFDAYGTLFDIHSAVSRHFDIVGDNLPAFLKFGATSNWSTLGFVLQ